MNGQARSDQFSTLVKSDKFTGLVKSDNRTSDFFYAALFCFALAFFFLFVFLIYGTPLLDKERGRY
jgi:hypothetical protein